jgi:hypothetical protein
MKYFIVPIMFMSQAHAINSDTFNRIELGLIVYSKAKLDICLNQLGRSGRWNERLCSFATPAEMAEYVNFISKMDKICGRDHGCVESIKLHKKIEDMNL